MSIYEPQVWRANGDELTPRVPASWTELTLGAQGTAEPTINLASLDPSGLRWRMVCASGLFSSVVDNVCRWGWNVGGAGGREDQGAHAIFVQLESDYYNGTDHYAEWIVGWLNDDGTLSRRPISSAVNLRNGLCQSGVEGQFAVYDSGRTQPARFNVADTAQPVTRAYFDDAIPTVQPTDTPALAQLNPAGSAYTEIARVNASGYVQLSGAGGMTQTNGGLIVKSGTGQSWSDGAFTRGLLLQEANTTRWNLAPFGSTTTLECGANMTITGGRDLAMSPSSGAAPDNAITRVGVAMLAPNVAFSLWSYLVPIGGLISLEFKLSCKNSSGSAWGYFGKVATIARNGSGAAAIVGGPGQLWMQRSSTDFEPFVFLSGNVVGVFATSNAIAPILSWTGTVNRITI